MPRVTPKTSKSGFHLNPNADVVLHFSFDCHVGADGFAGTVYTRVVATKFGKHVQWLDAEPISVQGHRHTAIKPESLIYLRPLYEQFSRDLVREFRAQGSAPIWIELEYERQEFDRTLIAVNVAQQASFAHRHIVVGASVTLLPAGQVRQSPLRDAQTGLLTVVFLNHGPYAR